MYDKSPTYSKTQLIGELASCDFVFVLQAARRRKCLTEAE